MKIYTHFGHSSEMFEYLTVQVLVSIIYVQYAIYEGSHE